MSFNEICYVSKKNIWDPLRVEDLLEIMPRFCPEAKILSTAFHWVEICESIFAGLPNPIPVFA